MAEISIPFLIISVFRDVLPFQTRVTTSDGDSEKFLESSITNILGHSRNISTQKRVSVACKKHWFWFKNSKRFSLKHPL
jgi:hypothetical protein